MLSRTLESSLKLSAAEYPIVAILGPRQSGKTTLAMHTFPQHKYISLNQELM